MRDDDRSPRPQPAQSASGHRKNQSSNPPRVSGPNCHDQRKPIRNRKNGTLQLAKRKLRYIFLEADRQDRRSTLRNGTPFEHPRRMPTHKAKEKGEAPDRNKAIQKEVAKLVEAGIMREVHYHDWLSNPIMPFKCILDAYKGYHQIQIAKEDEEKTAFHTNQGVLCYRKMSFGLKNAGATYQRLIDKAFEKQIGRNLEVYVDDLVIKSHTESEILRDIEETFHNLRKINMKPNPKKMHIWCGRRSVLRLRSQHVGNQSLSRKGGSSGETTLSVNSERSSNPKTDSYPNPQRSHSLSSRPSKDV
ncbi:reverse transcriptase domain-containing protein [Tanacetum coccineum]